MAIPAEMMRQFSEMMAQQMAAITAQYEAHMKATNENHTQQIQMMLNQIQNLGGTQSGLETNYNREKLDPKVFTKVDKFDGEWKDWSFTFKSAVRSSSHDAFALLYWAEKEESEIIDVDAQAPNNIRDASDLDSASFNQIAMLMKGESMQIMHNSNFSGTEAWRRLTKRYSPTTPVRGLQLMMSVVSPQKITKGNKVLEMIERWETKILALERDFNERLSERMKAGVLLNMMPGDLQNSLIQQADKLENFKMAKEKVVSIMEAKNALHPDAMDIDNVNYESYDNTDQDDGEEEDLGDVHIDSMCNRCGGKGHFARNCGTPDPGGKGKGKGKGKDGKGFSQQQAKGSSRDPIICQYCNKKGHTAKECWKKEREENRDRSANYVDKDACNVDCMGFDMASLECEKAVAPRTQGWQMVKPRASCSSRVKDVPSCNHLRDQQRSNCYSLLMSSNSLPGLCHPIKEKDEDGDIVEGETMEVNVVDERRRTLARSRLIRVQPKTFFHEITSPEFLYSLLQDHSEEPASSQPTEPGWRIWAKSASTSRPQMALRATYCSKLQIQGNH